MAYVASVLLVSMDPMVVNLMLPTLGRHFGAPLASAQWAVVGYMMSVAIFMPLSGWLGDRFGTKRTFLAALTLFALGSIACSLAQALDALVAFRVVQGVGGGLLTPVAAAMLFRAFAPSERAHVARTLFVPIMLGPVLAQPLGGLLVEHVSWRWAFYLNVPTAGAALVISWLYLVERRAPVRRHLDLRGFALAGLGLSMVTLGFTQVALRGWAAPSVLVPGALGVLALAGFLRHARDAADPILEVGLFRNRIFRATNVVFVMNTLGFMGLTFLVPIFLQQAMGVGVMTAGLTTFAMAIGLVVGTQTLGRLYTRVGPRLLTVAGCLGLAASLLACVLMGEGTSRWWVRLALFGGGAAQAAIGLSLHTAMFASVAATDLGSGSAIYYAGRQAASAVGIALLTTVVASAGGGTVGAFHVAFVVAAAVTACTAIAAARLIHDEDARATLVTQVDRAAAVAE